jgi:tetratricopeptide (TPR) repeat protein
MGDSMKRTVVIPVVLILAILSFTAGAAAQTTGQPAQQNPPAAGQAPASGAAPAAGAAAGPAVKRPPQAKTQPEFDAYKLAAANTDPAAMEKAADDFATKFPDSEIRILLYENAMRLYQNANNAEKTEAMGRKVLSLDGDNPEALVMVAEIIAERTRDSDIDKDQRYAEAIAMAQKSILTLETDLSVPAGTPQDKIDAYKADRRSRAYSIIGTIQFKKEDYAAAQENLQKSIDADPADPDAVVILRLALALDKQTKYPEALKVVIRAVDLTEKQATGVVGTAARHERDRLQQLTGGATPAPAQTPPKN